MQTFFKIFTTPFLPVRGTVNKKSCMKSANINILKCERINLEKNQSSKNFDVHKYPFPLNSKSKHKYDKYLISDNLNVK